MTEKRLTRRRLLLGTVAVAGGGLALTWLGEDADEQKLGIVSGTFEPNAYLQILPTGQIVLQVDKFEMGQGVMTGFVTLLAEELGARPEQIITRHAPVHPLFQDPSMMTGGSESMRKRWVVIRQTGAAARQMLIIAAADRWGVSPELVSTTGTAQLLNKQTGERLAYRQVTEAAAERSVPGDVPLKSADQFQWIGKAVNRPDVPAKVTGTALFGIDIVLPGMLIAAVLRPPQIGSQLLGFDVSAAERSEGVYRVFPIHSGIAVVAQSWWHANQALQKIEAEWSETSLVATDVSDIHRLQAEQLDAGELIEARDDGDVEAAFNAAERTLEAEYKLPFLAHATMEPMNATVSLTDDFCEVWTGTQAPDLIREVAAEMTGLRREQIEVHTTFGGGGFGRRVFADYAAEAIAIAKQAGVPVKLVWSREDDMRHDFFRGANLHRTKVALNARNQPIAWRHQIVAANVSKNFMRPVMATLAPEWMPDGVHQGFADFA
ncbi:MAG: molybdopterin-dependent oxidoreductase, partial [Gammaproteobacteria bacterium]|nr:molybdopterin-dependent oxidoreductase [Gammaproteobacteria bacterium]